MYLNEFIKKEKIPISQRLHSAAIVLFGSIFAGLAMILVAPFSSIRALFTSERLVPDTSKIHVHMVGPEQAGMLAQNPNDIENTKQQIFDLFDPREDWKKAHDEEFGEDEPQN